MAKLEKEGRRRPVLLFENVKGTRFPVITNLHASRSRLAAAINAAHDAMLPSYLRAMERPLPPKVVETGPVKEVVRRGADVDLMTLPQIVHHDRDAGSQLADRAIDSGDHLLCEILRSLHEDSQWHLQWSIDLFAMLSAEAGPNPCR